MLFDIRAYNREAAVRYAHEWAYSRNPDYYDFENIGGDCTNFASQCLYAGDAIMNETPIYGWYYRNVNDRAPAWTGVNEFYRFMTTNQGLGPFGFEAAIQDVELGDFVQLAVHGDRYHHTPIIVKILNGERTLRNILVAAHSYDVDYRPLSTYNARKLRFIHIEAIRIPERGEDAVQAF